MGIPLFWTTATGSRKNNARRCDNIHRQPQKKWRLRHTNKWMKWILNLPVRGKWKWQLRIERDPWPCLQNDTGDPVHAECVSAADDDVGAGCCCNRRWTSIDARWRTPAPVNSRWVADASVSLDQLHLSCSTRDGRLVGDGCYVAAADALATQTQNSDELIYGWSDDLHSSLFVGLPHGSRPDEQRVSLQIHKCN